MEHTKGKWTIHKDGNDQLLYIYSEDTTQWICELARHGRDHKLPQIEIDRREANARLIAAAPETAQQRDDLLEACQGSVIVINELLAILDNFVKAKQLSPFPHPPLKGIKATITNAGGEVYETAIQAKQAIAQAT